MKFKIIIICSLLMLLGCSHINGPSQAKFPNYQYPLEIGNSWTYEHSKFYYNIVPDTNRDLFIDIELDTFYIEVVSLNTIDDSLEMYALRRYRLDSLNTKLYEGRASFYRNSEDGLIIRSFIEGGYAFPISGMNLENENKIESNKANSSLSNLLSIKYPIELNSVWTYFDKSIFSIYKHIFSIENFATKAGDYNCFVVEWIYYNSELTVFDYISEIGLMKRTIERENIHLTRNDYTTVYDFKEVYTLIDFTQGQ